VDYFSKATLYNAKWRYQFYHRDGGYLGYWLGLELELWLWLGLGLELGLGLGLGFGFELGVVAQWL